MPSESATPAETQDPVVLARREGMVLVLTINRPEVRNAIDSTVAMAIGTALEGAESDPEVRAIILTGAGDKAFCAGADLKARARGGSTTIEGELGDRWGFAGYVKNCVSKPLIAAVNGFALGGGTELALASDLVVAVDNAEFGLPEVKRGVIAAAGGAFRLPTQIPSKVAMEMILTGLPISAQRALELGLINRVVPRGELMAAALELAEAICRNSPLSVRASKRIARGIVDGEVPGERASWAQSKGEMQRLRESDDYREGIEAFAEKRAPQWRGV